MAALLLLTGGPQVILMVNGVTFLISGLALLTLRFGGRPARSPAETAGHALVGLLREAREGLGAVRHTPGLRAVLAGSACALFFGGLVNVAELPFLTEDLDASDAVFSVAVALAGLGIVAGSLTGTSGGVLEKLKGRYLVGLTLMGAGFLITGFAPAYGFVFVTFALAGFGNGMMLVHERLIIQATVSDSMTGRVFGTKDALTAWAFAISFLLAGAAVSAVGPVAVLVASGAGVLVVAAASALGLRGDESLQASQPRGDRLVQVDAAALSATSRSGAEVP